MSALPDPANPMRDLSARQMAWWRFSRNPAAMIGAAIVVSVVLAAILAPWLAPSPESAGSFAHSAPDAQVSWEHVLDALDRTLRSWTTDDGGAP